MKISLNFTAVIVSLNFLCLAAFADQSENFEINGVEDVYIPIKHIKNNIDSSYDIDTLTGFKIIKLMSITPNQKMIEKNRLALAKLKEEGGEKDYSSGILPFKDFDPDNGSVDLGMGNVPVLDQGRYGTCVTFSSTAALDAKLNLGDYIDQQCVLALNKGLGFNFWNGAKNAVQILNPLKQNGIIEKGNCFGTKYADPSQIINVSEYRNRSTQDYKDQINFTYLKTSNLDRLKKALNSKNRVIIGTSLANIKRNPISVNGFDMKINDEQTNGGLWACQQPSDDVNYCPENPKAGHEVIIIGYDDNQQLLKVRNSWGTNIGDNGNYYMTYAFFNAMVSDQTELK